MAKPSKKDKRSEKRDDDEGESLIGHNSDAKANKKEMLQAIESYERVKEEAKELNTDANEIINGLVSRGYDKKAIMTIIKERKMRADERSHVNHITDLYRMTLGMD